LAGRADLVPPLGGGDRVRIIHGPFEKFEGVVDDINQQKGTVRVIVTIFGRPTPIDFEPWQVERT
jgi:transcriptional antiterminator NusG